MNNNYTGHTTTSLSIRLSLHLSDHRSIRTQLSTHGDLQTPVRKMLMQNTTIILIHMQKTTIKYNESIINKERRQFLVISIMNTA